MALCFLPCVISFYQPEESFSSSDISSELHERDGTLFGFFFAASRLFIIESSIGVDIFEEYSFLSGSTFLHSLTFFKPLLLADEP